MSTKASVSISDQQDKFARGLVEDGKYSSLSAVVQHGLELLKQEVEMSQAELEALRALIKTRAEGDFVPMEEAQKSTSAMIEQKKRDLGL